MQIPFVDLHSQYLLIKKEIDQAIHDVIDSSSFVRGPYVEKFENKFAKKMGLKYCISCANGTDALFISMKSLKVKSGDEVIVPANSWISTAETVTLAGAKVIFCDVNKNDFTIDHNDIKKKINSRTVGIIPVHLYGHPANMQKIKALAKKNNLWIIEDCAQSHLAKYKRKLVGTFGEISTFSFYPSKNLGAMGDAGAILTNDKKLFEFCSKFARHGGLKKGSHEIEGMNSRMDGIQAAVLSVKLKYLDKWTLLRQKVAKSYLDQLKNCSAIKLPSVNKDIDHVWHLFVIKTDYRNELASFLKSKGINTGINYPISLPFLKAYKRYNYHPSDFPNAYFNQSRILSLPIYPELTKNKINFICTQIKKFLKT